MKRNGEWRLSPAFDICHSYRPSSDWVSQQSLSVNGKRQDITRGDLLSVSEQMHIKKAAYIIDQIHDIVQNWKHYAMKVDVSPALTRAIQKTLNLI